MIIGLVGKRNAGKDTVGAYLVKQRGFERKAFADPLKHSVATLFDIPFSEIDKLKLDLTTGIGIGRQDQNNHLIPHSVGRSMTFREFLQRYGTEAHRDMFGDNFWVDQCLPIDGFYSGRAIVITDCRFLNEAQRINELKGLVVRVERPGLEDQDPHSSEKEQEKIKPHWIIENSGTIEFLNKQIEYMLEHARVP